MGMSRIERHKPDGEEVEVEFSSEDDDSEFVDDDVVLEFWPFPRVK